MTFSDKIKVTREHLGFTQQQLADKTGVSKRTIASYESGGAMARSSTILKLAKALQVSSRYLTEETCDDPLKDIEKDAYLTEAHLRYGNSAIRDMDELLRDNAALFAGGTLSQTQKDKFFEAVTQAYFACREEARKKYGRKNNA